MRVPFSQEALNIAYKSGTRELAPLVEGIFNLEAQLAALMARLDAVERAQKKSVPPHLSRVERRYEGLGDHQ